MSGSTMRQPRAPTGGQAGGGKAGRPGKAALAGQAGQRLAAERRSRGITQAQLARAMGVTPGRVSQIERGGPATIEATARYITALGGELSLVASLGGAPVIIATTAPPGLGGDPGMAGPARTSRPAARLELIADFGDQRLAFAEPGTETA